jgi:hypothetical protein
MDLHCKDRRGDTIEVDGGCPLDSIDIISFVTMIKRK